MISQGSQGNVIVKLKKSGDSKAKERDLLGDLGVRICCMIFITQIHQLTRRTNSPAGSSDSPTHQTLRY